MKAANKKKKRINLLLKVAIVAFSVYLVVTLVQLNLTYGKQRERLDELSHAIEEQRLFNEELNARNSNIEKYQEQQARENGMVRDGEEIFLEIPGDGTENSAA